MKRSRLLLFSAGMAVILPFLHAESPAAGEKVPPNPEQRAILKAAVAIPADQAALRIDVKTTTPDGNPNLNFGKPLPAFLERHGQFLERRKQPMDVLFLGDSITQRWESLGAPVWAELFASSKAANFGISGDLRLWEPFLDEKGVLKKELMPDALHPNEAGYRIMGQAIKDKLAGMVSP